MSGSEKSHRSDELSAFISATRAAQETVALESMVRSVIACPELLVMAEEFSDAAYVRALQLPETEQARALASADPMSFKANTKLANIVAIARVLRSKIATPPSPLEQWDPGGGARQ